MTFLYRKLSENFHGILWKSTAIFPEISGKIPREISGKIPQEISKLRDEYDQFEVLNGLPVSSKLLTTIGTSMSAAAILQTHEYVGNVQIQRSCFVDSVSSRSELTQSP